MKTFRIREIAAGCLSLVLLIVGCGTSETPSQIGRGVDRASPLAKSPKFEVAAEELHATFLKVSPELTSVIDARNSLLRNGVMSSDNSELLRTSAATYRESLLTLRRKFFDLELVVGVESVRRLIDFVISEGLVLPPEVMADIEPNSWTRAFPSSRES